MSLLMYVNCNIDESFGFESQNLRGFKPLATLSLTCRQYMDPDAADSNSTVSFSSGLMASSDDDLSASECSVVRLTAIATATAS